MAPKRKAKLAGKMAVPVVDEQYSGADLVTAALRESKLEVRADAAAKFRYVAMGSCAGLVSSSAHRLLQLPTHCELVAADCGKLRSYEVLRGSADHVVSLHSPQQWFAMRGNNPHAPCCRHSGSLCQVIPSAPPDAVYLTTTSMRRRSMDDDGSMPDEISPAILLCKPQFFVAVTTRKEHIEVEGYYQVTEHFRHEDLLSPIGGGMYLTLGARDGNRTVECMMDTVRSMVTKCDGGIRSITGNMKETRQQKRAAPGPVECDDQVKYYGAMAEVEKAAKAAKVKLDIPANESDRASASLRLTLCGGNPRALALADAYQKLPLEGNPTPMPASARHCRIADVGKPFHTSRVQANGKTPELSKGSIPVSYMLMQPLCGKDIGHCKGLKFDKHGARLLGRSEVCELACMAPSAVLVAFATAAVAAETGHVIRR